MCFTMNRKIKIKETCILTNVKLVYFISNIFNKIMTKNLNKYTNLTI